jgi:hypothetical protein
MALFDTNQGGGLFNSLPNIFMTPDFSQTGILTPDQQKELRNQATKAGLLGSALTYFATPQTENYGSIVPYLAKAGLGGMGAAQDIYGSGLTNLYRNKILESRNEAKEPTLPTSAQEFERAKSDPAYMKFLREKWDAENKATRAGIQAEESAYNIGTPQQSVSVTAGGKTYYFKDQNSANLFKQKAGIK